MTQPLPRVTPASANVDSLAAALSLSPAQIGDSGLPVEAIYNGITVLVVPAVSRGAVEAIRPGGAALERLSDELGVQTILVFTTETCDPANTVHCRVFAPGAGVLEDAATGSANGPLGTYLVRHRLVDVKPITRVISEQGYEMQRPSRLEIEMEVNPDSGEVLSVRVGGGVIRSGQGQIVLD